MFSSLKSLDVYCYIVKQLNEILFVALFKYNMLLVTYASTLWYFFDDKIIPLMICGIYS